LRALRISSEHSTRYPAHSLIISDTRANSGVQWIQSAADTLGWRAFVPDSDDMTFTEALKVAAPKQGTAAPYSVLVACGFTPLHLKVFLAAHLQLAMPGRRVEPSVGVFGDISGTVENAPAGLHGMAIAIEWQDLDPRLGYREGGAWSSAAVNEIASLAQLRLSRLAGAINRHPAGTRIAVSLPTLPLPPAFGAAGWQTAEADLHLESVVNEFALAVAGRATIVNRRRLAEVSPPASRLDLKSDLLTGLPWSLAHADAVGDALGRLLAPPSPKKGIITDLDNTLWKGIVGEVGADKVSWDLAGHSQLHALYQKLLASLAEQGTLIAVASKNDAAIAGEALTRSDLLLKPDAVFPMEIHWNAKSGSVRKILETWNIGAESVIFVDDSPMELAEVGAAFPEIECIRFPEGDYAAGLQMLWRIRDLCGKEKVSAEDSLRLGSIRAASALREVGEHDAESFLRDAEAVVEVEFPRGTGAPRILELVNKTNQFNLNGVRYGEQDWRQSCEREGAVLAAVSYSDKFGPLGVIAVIHGALEGKRLRMGCWVMSCRAFSRRIEHQSLRILFDRYGVEEICLEFQPTAKNGPTEEFCRKVAGTEAGPVIVTKEQFEAVSPPLYHRVVIHDGTKQDRAANHE
jgi:FkbH-like protein